MTGPEVEVGKAEALVVVREQMGVVVDLCLGRESVQVESLAIETWC